MELSAAQFATVLDNLAAFPVESALRQVEIHRTNGDFSASCCDRLAAAVQRRGF